MTRPMDDELALIAKRLRTWRDEADFTLQQLAERCGVATSTIQKIETRQMVPTIAVLLKIANGLRKNVSDFVARDDSTYRVHHATKAMRRVFGDGQIRVERLVGDLASPELEVWRVNCDADAGSFRQGVHSHGEVLVICEAGAMTVSVDGKDFEMQEGDTLHFKAELPHGWENHPDSPVQFLVIGTLPPALRAVIEDSKLPGAE